MIGISDMATCIAVTYNAGFDMAYIHAHRPESDAPCTVCAHHYTFHLRPTQNMPMPLMTQHPDAIHNVALKHLVP